MFYNIIILGWLYVFYRDCMYNPTEKLPMIMIPRDRSLYDGKRKRIPLSDDAGSSLRRNWDSTVIMHTRVYVAALI